MLQKTLKMLQKTYNTDKQKIKKKKNEINAPVIYAQAKAISSTFTMAILRHINILIVRSAHPLIH